MAERLEDQFLRRFPTEAAYQQTTNADLQVILSRLRQARTRLVDLKEKRRKIDAEIEFHPDRHLPPDLARRLDESEALFGAMADLFQAIEHDIGILMRRAACERKQFAGLWQGAARGSSACAGACA